MPEEEEICRMRAEKCRERAEEAISPDEQSMWTTLADEWLRLAEHRARIRMTVPPVSQTDRGRDDPLWRLPGADHSARADVTGRDRR
jgi:hypothetical protein